MKIALIIYGSLDTLSGGYLYDRQLVSLLRERGCTVDIWSLPWRNYASHLRDNFRFSWARQLAAGGYDLIIQDELNHPSLCVMNHLLQRLCASPIISIVHHLRSSETHPPAYLPLYRWIERTYLRTVDGLIYNSITTRLHAEALSGQGKKHIIAYPAADHVNPPSHDHVVDAISTRLRAAGAIQLLFIGNIIERKSLHNVLEALARLESRNWHLHIAGSQDVDPTYSAAMRHRANTYSLSSHVRWHGRVSDSELFSLLSRCDLLVMPSYEGFGIVYLEAMAYGIPVLAANIGAAPEIIAPGANGYLITHGDSRQLAGIIDLLIGNRVHLATLAYHARLRYEAHPTWTESMHKAFLWLREFSNLSSN